MKFVKFIGEINLCLIYNLSMVIRLAVFVCIFSKSIWMNFKRSVNNWCCWGRVFDFSIVWIQIDVLAFPVIVQRWECLINRGIGWKLIGYFTGFDSICCLVDWNLWFCLCRSEIYDIELINLNKFALITA